MAKFTDEAVARVLRATRAYRVVEVPVPTPSDERASVRVAVRLLSDLELDVCRVDAIERLSKDAKRAGLADVSVLTDADPEHLQRVVFREIIWKAFFDADTITQSKPEAFFPSLRDVESLDSVLVQRFFDTYLEHQSVAAPLRSMSEEEVKAFVEALGKERSVEAALSGYERSTLLRLVLSMVARLRS